MNVLQRGVRSVLRKPIKSIILLFIVIVMSGLFLGAMASRSASIYTQDATRQAIGATFRIEGNEENRRKRLDQAMDVLGDREGSYGGVTHKWLENGADMVVTDNSFETVKEDDVKKIAQVEGIEEYNLITIETDLLLFHLLCEDIFLSSDEFARQQMGHHLQGNRRPLCAIFGCLHQHSHFSL